MNAYVKINEIDYEVEDISLPAKNLLRIKYIGKKPTGYSGLIESYTSGGVLATSFEGYETVYRQIDEQTDIISNDGSVYTEPVYPDDPDIPEYEPSIEDIRRWKRADISSACQFTIHNGIDVKLMDGSTEHFSLTTEDQLNLFGKQAQLAAGAQQCEYHADGEICRYYDAEDMQTIISAAMQFVSYHTTYCNSFFTWIEAEDDKDVISAMGYGDQVPEEYKSEVLKAYEAAM